MKENGKAPVTEVKVPCRAGQDRNGLLKCDITVFNPTLINRKWNSCNDFGLMWVPLLMEHNRTICFVVGPMSQDYID